MDRQRERLVDDFRSSSLDRKSLFSRLEQLEDALGHLAQQFASIQRGRTSGTVDDDSVVSTPSNASSTSGFSGQYKDPPSPRAGPRPGPGAGGGGGGDSSARPVKSEAMNPTSPRSSRKLLTKDGSVGTLRRSPRSIAVGLSVYDTAHFASNSRVRASRPNRFKTAATSMKGSEYGRRRTPSPILRMPGEKSGQGEVVGGHH